jgi:hypothetical protein
MGKNVDGKGTSKGEMRPKSCIGTDTDQSLRGCTGQGLCLQGYEQLLLIVVRREVTW